MLVLSPSRNPNPSVGVARESNEFEPSIIRAARVRGEVFPKHAAEANDREQSPGLSRPLACTRAHLYARARGQKNLLAARLVRETTARAPARMQSL